MTEEESNSSFEYTPTWVVALVCFVFVFLSFVAERGIHHLGKHLRRQNQDALFQALQKLKEELMLLGFISLLLTVSQGAIRKICVPPHLMIHMLPCKRHAATNHNPRHFRHLVISNGRRILTGDNGAEVCAKGKVPLLSLEALHQLHIFIFVLAVVHMIFCVTTMLLGGARIRQWKHWEASIRRDSTDYESRQHKNEFFEEHAGGYWRKTAVVSWLRSFFKQFYGSVNKSDYIALRRGFIMKHCPTHPLFDFHKYMLRTLEIDFKKVVGISWYLWLFVVLFLLLNVNGWNTFFWLSFLPLVLLLLVGTKLQHIISTLSLEVTDKKDSDKEINPSDQLFWFHRPGIVLILIHFILFQNSFEIAFFFWILSTYGFDSCIMEKVGYIVARLAIGVIVQVLCSYSTFPLYALVTQMGSRFKRGIFDEHIHSSLEKWIKGLRSGEEGGNNESSLQMYVMDKEPSQDILRAIPTVNLTGETTECIDIPQSSA